MKKTLYYILGYVLLCISYVVLLSIAMLAFIHTGKSILSNVIISVFSILYMFLCIIYGLYWRRKAFSKRNNVIIIGLAIGYCIYAVIQTGFNINLYHIYLQVFPLIYALLIICILEINNKR